MIYMLDDSALIDFIVRNVYIIGVNYEAQSLQEFGHIPPK